MKQAGSHCKLGYHHTLQDSSPHLSVSKIHWIKKNNEVLKKLTWNTVKIARGKSSKFDFGLSSWLNLKVKKY